MIINILTFENYNATFSLQLWVEFEFKTANGDYILKIFEEDCFLLILPSGKHFVADFEFLYEQGGNHLLDQYENGKVRKWIIGCLKGIL